MTEITKPFRDLSKIFKNVLENSEAFSDFFNAKEFNNEYCVPIHKK